MSSKYLRVNLEDVIEQYGEDRVKTILADFSCPKNKDIENFIRYKAIEFSRQSIAKTQLIYYVENPEKTDCKKILVGYYSLTQKTITIAKKALSNKLRKRIGKFSDVDVDKNTFTLPVILIGQLGKNYTNNSNKYIKGDELLALAFQSITIVQKYIGGKFIYLECEDNEKVRKFYKDAGFYMFGERSLDRDEIDDIKGKCLLQWIYYMQ